MKTKLSLLFIWLKKPIILLSVISAMATIGLNQWLEYRDFSVNEDPWILASVETGDQFTVTRGGKSKSINLCGVEANEKTAKEFLRSVIGLGNGTVELEQVNGGYEAWILLDKDYDVELVKHISDKPDELIEAQIHLNTWMIERGYAKRDLATSYQCSEPEALVWAEKSTSKKS